MTRPPSDRISELSCTIPHSRPPTETQPEVRDMDEARPYTRRPEHVG